MPNRAININTNCEVLINSLKIYEAKIVAVNGWSKSPIDPLDAEILDIPYVIKNWPPNWHNKASNNKLVHSNFVEGMDKPDSIKANGKENKQQKKVV